MFDVITIGSATKDVFLISKDFLLVKSSKFSTGIGECFAYGAKIEVADIHMDTGGGATNAAVTFAHMGLRVAASTNIGDDVSGVEIQETLKHHGVSTSLIHTHPQLQTGYSTILLSSKGDRTILVYRGASQDFQAKNLKVEKMKARWFYLTSAAGNMPFNKAVFSIARKNKTHVFWNPGSGELSQGMKKLKPFLQQTAVLSLNKEEAQKLTGEREPSAQLDALGALTPLVWVTDGKVGAYFNAAGEKYFVPSLGTPALNATGAGDAFGSGFLAGLIVTDDWRQAAAYGILNSDGVIQQMGAKTGILTKRPSGSQRARVHIKPL